MHAVCNNSCKNYGKFSPGVLVGFKFPNEIHSKRIVLGTCQPCLLVIIGVHDLEVLYVGSR